VGILVGSTIPTFTKLTQKSQITVNKANMTIIKNAFLQYFYDNHIKGNPEFPTEPEDNLLSEEYRDVFLSDGRRVNMLFNGDMPLNSNNNPFFYEHTFDTTNGYITRGFIIKDIDESSPSYEDAVVAEI